MTLSGRNRLIMTIAAITAGGASVGLMAPAQAGAPNPAVVGPLTASGSAMTAAIPPIACQQAASAAASEIYSQPAVAGVVLPLVGQANDACAQASVAGSGALREVGAASAPAAAANPVANPALDVGAGVASAAAAQLPPQASMLGPGPSDVAPAFTYLKGS